MRRLFLFLLLIPLVALTPLRASAATEPGDVLTALSDGLPSLSAAALPEGIADADAVREAVGVRHLFEAVLTGFKDSVPPVFRTALMLSGALLLYAVLATLLASHGAEILRVTDAAFGVLFALLIFEGFSACFDRTAAYLSDMQALAELAAPAMGALYLAGGNAGSAAAGGGAMAALSLILEHLVGAALLPLLRMMLGFLLVSAIGEVRTEGLCTTLRTVYVTVLGIFCTLTSAALALGNILGAAGDSLSLRSLRFAVGQMVPIVGSTVSGGLATVGASVGLVRSTAGIGLAAAIVLPLFGVVCELLLARMALSLLSTLGTLFGAATPVRLLRGFRSLFDLCLAAAVFSAMLFVFIAALFAACRPAVL